MANMLYNGVELPDIETVWTDKVTYPYAVITGAVLNLASKAYARGDSLHLMDGATYTVNFRDLLWTYTQVFSYQQLEISLYPKLWVGRDVYNYAGDTLMIQATDPVPVSPEIPNMTRDLALLLGNAVRRGLMAVREPVAWLYNGVRLPDIYSVYTPQLQKTHPYVAIGKYLGAYYLMISDTPMTTYSGGEKLRDSSENGLKYRLNVDGEYWEQIDAFYTGRWPVWSNHDTVDEDDGKTYLAATDPIPVYE